MYLGYQDGKIKFYTEEPLDKDFYNIEKVEETELEYVLDGEEYVLKDEAWEEKQKQIEKERIQELKMTMSDFFDGTIAAWGADKADLKPIIEDTLVLLPLDDITKKKALNNYENAQNFYRKHTLFTLLSNRKLELNETMQVIVTEEHWDKFFDETDKKNPEAYKELPTPELILVEEEEEDILA